MFVFVTRQLCDKNKHGTKPSEPIEDFDGAAYDTLITIQAALNAAKAEIPQYPQFKPQLNQAIASYNVAMDAYLTYHKTVGILLTTQCCRRTATSLVAEVATLEKSFGLQLPVQEVVK